MGGGLRRGRVVKFMNERHSMTITLTKKKLAVAILAVAMVVPATAYAAHVFADVDDGAFYAGRDQAIARASLDLAGMVGLALIKANCPSIRDDIQRLIGNSR